MNFGSSRVRVRKALAACRQQARVRAISGTHSASFVVDLKCCFEGFAINQAGTAPFSKLAISVIINLRRLEYGRPLLQYRGVAAKHLKDLRQVIRCCQTYLSSWHPPRSRWCCHATFVLVIGLARQKALKLPRKVSGLAQRPNLMGLRPQKRCSLASTISSCSFSGKTSSLCGDVTRANSPSAFIAASLARCP